MLLLCFYDSALHSWIVSFSQQVVPMLWYQCCAIKAKQSAGSDVLPDYFICAFESTKILDEKASSLGNFEPFKVFYSSVCCHVEINVKYSHSGGKLLASPGLGDLKKQSRGFLA